MGRLSALPLGAGPLWPLRALWDAAARTGRLVFPAAAGSGIQFDATAPQYGFRDILGQIDDRGVGPNSPAYGKVGVSNIYLYEFSATLLKEVFIPFHVPHDYVPGTAVSFHAHWINGAATPNTGVVRWGFEWYYAVNSAGPWASGTVHAEQASHATPLVPLLVESPEVEIAGLEVDSIIMCRVFRDAANVADTCTDAVYLIQTDCHYQSTGVPTKNRNKDGPTEDFYT